MTFNTQRADVRLTARRIPMGIELKRMVEQHLKYPGDVTLTEQIMRLHPTARDFTDEFFNAFEPHQRLQIYLAIPIWCGLEAEAILQYRINTENDEQCKLTADLMLG